MTTPYISTDALETLARELFAGALPTLPADGMKRRAVLAREFKAAHLTVPGVTKPDAAKLAALAPAFRAIAASRQARVDAFLKTIAARPTAASVRQQLVAVLGEQALALRLLHARHSIAAALVLLDRLEGKPGAKLDFGDAAADTLAARLDAVLPGARAHFYPGGNVLHSLRGLGLLAQLADALAESNSTHAAAPPTAPRAEAATPPSPAVPVRTVPTLEQIAAQVRTEPDRRKRAKLYREFDLLAAQMARASRTNK